MGGDPEEAWYAKYQAALMQLVVGDPWEKVLSALLEAYGCWSQRAEPLYRIAVHYSTRGESVLAGLFAREAARIPCPEAGLFVERDVYEYRLPFETALYHAWAGEHGEAIRIFNQVMSTPGVAAEVYERSMVQRRLSVAAYPRVPVTAPREPRLKVCIPFRDPGHSLDNCVESLLAQRNVDFNAVFFDNGSVDDSSDAVPSEDPRMVLVRRAHTLATAEFVDLFLREHCDPDDVFVFLDGRDWLAHRDALSTLARLYAAAECDVLYGQYREANGQMGRAQPYPDALSLMQPVVRPPPHLIMTFRARLYQDLAREAGGRGCLRGLDGAWSAFGWDDDHALMSPILRRAGFDKVRFNDEVLYVLNTDVMRAPG
jgi:hypothetical protein